MQDERIDRDIHDMREDITEIKQILTAIQTNCKYQIDNTKKLDKQINGNGRAGVAQRMSRLEISMYIIIAYHVITDPFFRSLMGIWK